MSLISMQDGYYDDNGNWQRSKFCFVSCGSRCTCKPPGGRYYNPEKDKRLTKNMNTGEKRCK